MVVFDEKGPFWPANLRRFAVKTRRVARKHRWVGVTPRQFGTQLRWSAGTLRRWAAVPRRFAPKLRGSAAPPRRLAGPPRRIPAKLRGVAVKLGSSAVARTAVARRRSGFRSF